MAQWVTAPVTKPEDMRSIHEATMAEQRPDSHKLLTDTRVRCAEVGPPPVEQRTWKSMQKNFFSHLKIL